MSKKKRQYEVVEEKGPRKILFIPLTVPTAFIFGVLSVIIVGSIFYFGVNGLQNAQTRNNSTTLQAQKVVEDIGRMIQLPENETPQIATVSDVEKLKDQPFFADAKNGDVVLIYNASQKAVLYRPTEKKIINYSPVNLPQPVDNQQASASASVTGAPPPTQDPIKVMILNGSKESGLARRTQELIEKEGVDVVSVGNTKGDFSESSISQVSNSKTLTDAQLQSLVSPVSKSQFAVSSLPTSETAPANAEVVIILGEDFASAY